MPTKVVIAGGGVAGLTAAHELVKQGLEVHVYEKAQVFGGKAASQDATVNDQVCSNLGEHGFRFFPWFYRHLAETLREIGPPAPTVFDCLEPSSHGGFAFRGTLFPISRNPGVFDFFDILWNFTSAMGIPLDDVVRYSSYMLKFHTSCPQRRLAVYEHMSWASFCGMNSGEYDPNFQKLLESIPMMLVAMRASEGSARTLGKIGIQMLRDFDPATGPKPDAVLHGPTTKVWIDPWVAQLQSQGVQFHSGFELVGIKPAPAGGRIDALEFKKNGALQTVDVSGGYCVCALPIEAMAPLLTQQLIDMDPGLSDLKQLIDRNPKPWGNMAGVQYVLDVDVPMLKGHVAYPESDWAITTVSQAQFWRAGNRVNADLAQEFGVPGIRGVISAIASDWGKAVADPASPVDGKSAAQCTSDEVKDEIWRQILKSANKAFSEPPPDPMDAHLDENIQWQGGVLSNATPLLVHPPGIFETRPEARLANIDNLTLASDYVRTETDLATMEGANEAARHAVRAIFQALNVPSASWPQVYPIDEGPGDTGRDLDCVLFELGLPHPMDAVLGAQVVPQPQLVGFDALDTDRFVRLRREEPRDWVRAPRVRADRVIAPKEGQPVLGLPDLRLAYRPFPNELPREVDDRFRDAYASFRGQEKELTAVSRESYGRWKELLGMNPKSNTRSP